jgi:inward rectifier potassium channel
MKGEEYRSAQWERVEGLSRMAGAGGGGVGDLRQLLLRQQRKAQKLPLVDHKGRLNVETRGLPKTFLYWGDLFHTLVNMPTPRFLGILVLNYFLLFVGFGVPYYYDAYNNNCIPGVVTFDHALWFSVQTSMTIGYGGDLTPDPSCRLTNIMVVLQSLASLLVAYSLLGVFYVRFSRPARRAQTIIFSRYCTMHEEDGVPVISLRIANIRKHQIIEANVRLLIGFNNTLGGGGSEGDRDHETVFHFTSLPVIGGNQVFLGLPCSVKHPITSTSPLYGMSVTELEDADCELLVLLEGVDASTSCKLQARHSYLPKDIRRDVMHETMVFRSPNGRRCVDFSKFDTLLPVASASLITRPDSSVALPPISQASQAARYAFLASNAAAASRDGEEGEHSRMWDFLNSSASDLRGHAAATQSPRRPRRLLRTGSENSWLEQQNWYPQSSSVPAGLGFGRGNGDHFSLTASEASSETAELEQKLAAAEAQVHALKQQLVELATRVHQTLEQPSIAADADKGPLLAFASQALSMALSSP